MRAPRKDQRSDAENLEQQRAARRAAKSDPHLEEQVQTETEERPYLDTEGGE